MKKVLLMAMLLSSVTSLAMDISKSQDGPSETATEKKKSGGSSASLYSDVECDMSDFTCSKIIRDIARQEAIAYLLIDSKQVSSVLQQVMDSYRKADPSLLELSDEDLIYFLASE